jgi:hypothetical protein
VVGIVGQPWVIAEASSVRLQKQHTVVHDAKERLSWASRLTATWHVSRAARSLEGRAKHVSICATTLSSKKRLTAGHLLVLLLLRDILGKIRRLLALEGKGLLL